MGFSIPEVPLTAVGYAAAFSAHQIVDSLTSDYDHVSIFPLVDEAVRDLHHHSEGVYEVVVTVRKVED